jgi:crotonobetaine/carnitine-CoA ligase
VAAILYTSGTTGPPKGVMIPHNAYAVAGLEFVRNYVRIRADDVLYTSLPLFHVNAQQLTTMGALISGRPMALAERFSASGFFDDLARHGATVFNYIGAMLTMLHKQPPRPDDARGPARLAIGGAAPASLWRDFERRFGLRILEIYGLTETATVCLGNPPDDVRVGRVGMPVSWAEVRVEDGEGVEAPPDAPGEIVVRARRPDTLFLGYYRREEATAEAMRGGWFHTGDRGVRDADGYFTFLDRLKDCIRRRGENISSYEVERTLNEHPAVAESAAVGVPSDLGEEEVKAYVVLRPGAELAPAELIEFCSVRMADFMVPRYVELREELPKTATQRVQKFALRAEGIGGAWDRLAAGSAAGGAA